LYRRRPRSAGQAEDCLNREVRPVPVERRSECARFGKSLDVRIGVLRTGEKQPKQVPIVPLDQLLGGALEQKQQAVPAFLEILERRLGAGSRSPDGDGNQAIDTLGN